MNITGTVCNPRLAMYLSKPRVPLVTCSIKRPGGGASGDRRRRPTQLPVE